ncbi:TPA: hypothetical protein DDW35_12740 [Candidatus Sumerlaeota bacterium]|nr:hypothetical protein [Candidatus Sumerlaeota bacterium]
MHRPPRHQRRTLMPTGFLFGCAYYPEHWNDEDRQHDPEWMAAAGVTVVRMGEFAWDQIEPRKGQFDFNLFDIAIQRLSKAGIKTILSTPTAAPPRWLTEGHEQWMRVDENGNRMEHGSQQHCCTNNRAFRGKSRAITSALAEHYSGNASVVGWQIDNEFGCHFSHCYCPSCLEGFREWLRKKHGTIKKLNEAWGCAFWAQTYDDFEQIPLPYFNNRPAYANPSHELDYCRFQSESLIEFQRQQVEILRTTNSRWWITHNGMFPSVNYWELTKDLDLLGVDIYPGFSAKKPEDAVNTSFQLEHCRAASGRFIVPEQQAGPGGQKNYLHSTPSPGQMRLWAYQSIAHGADGILHFHWRTCRFGAETYWHGILDHDNIRRRRYEEFSQEGREFKKFAGKFNAAPLDIQVGILTDAEQNWAHDTLPLGLPGPEEQAALAFTELSHRHLPCGLIQLADDFQGPKLLILPSLPLMTPPLALRLTEFVNNGGVLAITARTAIRNQDNQAVNITPPIYLNELCGLSVIENGKTENETMLFGCADTVMPAGQMYEVAEMNNHTECLATWFPSADGGPSAATEQPAFTFHRVGNGAVIWVGTYFTPANIKPIFDQILHQVEIQPLADCATAVEITRRFNGYKAYRFLLNHTRTNQIISGLPEGTDLITGYPVTESTFTLAPYEVAVIEETALPATPEAQ